MQEQTPSVTRETGPFRAFRVMRYPTRADQVKKTHGQMRYALTERETRDRETSDIAPFVEEVVVTLKAGYFKVTTPEGHCGIRTGSGIIGLEQAIREGLAVVRDLSQ